MSEFWYTASERARSNSDLVRVLWAQLVNLQVLLNQSLIAYVDELRVNYLENPEAWSEVERGLEAYAALARELYEGLMALPAECWELDRITLPGSTARSR